MKGESLNSVTSRVLVLMMKLTFEYIFFSERTHIPHSCQIDWHKGKDVTVKTIKKKQKHKGRGTVRTVTKQVPNDSFFNFFNPIKGTNMKTCKPALHMTCCCVAPHLPAGGARFLSEPDCRAHVCWTLHTKLCLLDFYEYFISSSLLICFSVISHSDQH